MKKKKGQIEVLYLGQRLGFLGDIAHFFIDAKGEEHRFSGAMKFVWFGNSYWMDTKGKGSIAVEPERVDEQTLHTTDKQELQYESQKLAIRDYRNKKKKDMELKNPHPKVVRAIELLKPFVDAMDHNTESRFFGYIRNECSKPNKKRGKK